MAGTVDLFGLCRQLAYCQYTAPNGTLTLYEPLADPICAPPISSAIRYRWTGSGGGQRGHRIKKPVSYSTAVERKRNCRETIRLSIFVIRWETTAGQTTRYVPRTDINVTPDRLTVSMNQLFSFHGPRDRLNNTSL